MFAFKQEHHIYMLEGAIVHGFMDLSVSSFWFDVRICIMMGQESLSDPLWCARGFFSSHHVTQLKRKTKQLGSTFHAGRVYKEPAYILV